MVWLRWGGLVLFIPVNATEHLTLLNSELLVLCDARETVPSEKEAYSKAFDLFLSPTFLCKEGEFVWFPKPNAHKGGLKMWEGAFGFGCYAVTTAKNGKNQNDQGVPPCPPPRPDPPPRTGGPTLERILHGNHCEKLFQKKGGVMRESGRSLCPRS